MPELWLYKQIDKMIHWQIEHVDEVESTNKSLRESGDSLAEGYCLEASYQTGGKGQIGNQWESERGKNLLFSFVLKPHFLSPSRSFLLSKAISIAICNALNRYAEVFIKWPNDLYSGNKKLGGILIENAFMGNRLQQSIIGVGINIEQQTFLHAPHAVSLSMLSSDLTSSSVLLDAILDQIAIQYQRLLKEHYTDINRDYMKLLFRKSGFWPFRDEHGEFLAAIEKVEDSGCIVLKTNEGEVRNYWFKEVESIIKEAE